MKSVTRITMKKIVDGFIPEVDHLVEVAHIWGVCTSFIERAPKDPKDDPYIQFEGNFQAKSLIGEELEFEGRRVILGRMIEDELVARMEKREDGLAPIEIAYAVWMAKSSESMSGYRYEWLKPGESATPEDPAVLDKLKASFGA